MLSYFLDKSSHLLVCLYEHLQYCKFLHVTWFITTFSKSVPNSSLGAGLKQSYSKLNQACPH